MNNIRVQKYRRKFARGLLPAVLWCVSSAAFGQQQLGIGVHGGQPESAIDAALAQGPFSFRTDIFWADVEQTPGVLSIPASFNDVLALITSAVQRGEKPILVLDYGNKFYQGGNLPTTASAIAAYARFAGFVAGYFKGQVNQFEVWNEWNIGSGSPQTPAPTGSAGSYVNLLQAAYPAIKKANPNAVVIGGVVSSYATGWISNFIQAGGLNSLDAFSVHAYSYSAARQPKAPTNVASLFRQLAALTTPGIVPGTAEDSIASIDAVSSQIGNAASGKNIPIYVTEIGWPTNVGKWGVSEQAEAAYLQRFMLLARSRPYIGGIWWYDLFDDGATQTNPEFRFGLLQQNGSAKPAYSALLAVANIVGAPAAPTQSTGASGDIEISGQFGDNRKFFAAWLPTDDFTASVTVPTVGTLLQSGYAVRAGESSGIVSATPLLLSQ